MRRRVISSIMGSSSMSFAAGVLFMSGLNDLLRGSWHGYLELGLIPVFIFAAVMHARALLRLIPTT